MKILVGCLGSEYFPHDADRFDVRCIAVGRTGDRYPLSIAQMLEQCPPDWKPDVFLHPAIGHFPIPEDIEQFDGLAACLVGDWDRRGRATKAGLGFFDAAFGQRNLIPLLRANGFENVGFTRMWSFDAALHRALPNVERDIDILSLERCNR